MKLRLAFHCLVVFVLVAAGFWPIAVGWALGMTVFELAIQAWAALVEEVETRR